MSITPMPSLHSSIGSKSSSFRLNLYQNPQNNNNHFQYPEKETSKAFQSLWIQRLLPSPSPNLQTNQPTKTLAREKPPSFSDQLNTISTDESRTPATISNFQSAFLSGRLLKFRQQREGQTHGHCFVSGFGPFQFRTNKDLFPPNSVPDPSSVIGFFGQDCSIGFDKEKCVNSKNSLGGHNWVSLKSDRSEKNCVDSGNSHGGHNRVSVKNDRSEKNFMDDGSGSGKAEIMIPSSVPERRVSAYDHDKVRLSPFFQFRPPIAPSQDALKKYDYLKESRLNAFVGSTSDEYMFSRPPLEESKNKFMEPDRTPRNSNPRWPVDNEKRCYDSPDQRLYEQRPSVEPWHTATAIVHGVRYASKSRGATYHDNANDTTSCRAFCDPHLTHHNIVLRQQERPDPACSNKPGEAFPFWNMDGFERAKAVTSFFPAFTGSKSSGRKRNSDRDEFFSAKYRKLGSGD
ncbi:uncharacterized protein LOC143847065 [Tasmannia lanceolata]|uniref:uncharacterized protein LOC143847065 n=1 Tax=Tasmannia lanceolata TaxID=3420 RepID=UPI0040641478